MSDSPDGRQAFAEQRFRDAWSPSSFDATRAERMRELLGRRPPGRLLDLGCYDGQLIRAVAPRAVPIVGLDVSMGALRSARRRGIRGIRAQVEGRLPFRDGAFSTVVAAEVIEHVFDTQAFLNEIARLLRPGGWALVTTPNLAALSGRVKLLLGQSPANVEIDAGPGASGHIRYLTFETLELLLRRAGLEPFGRWTNVVYFPVLGSNELAGRLRPSLGQTLVSVARRRR